VTTTSTAGLAVGRWTVDPAHSTATFRVHSLGRTVSGNVPITEGTVDVDESGRPRAISGSLDLGAIDTGNPRRDKDLRKPRFLDLDRYPAMTFAADSAADSTTETPAGWRVTGQLAVRGTSVRLAGDAAVSPHHRSAHDRSATVTAHTQLDRRTLGIRAPRIMIGHAIDITVTAELRLTAQQ
jgi:polyisoprenoid-binding protein YceI